MFSFFASMSPLGKLSLRLLLILVAAALAGLLLLGALEKAKKEGYAQRVAQEQAMALSAARDAAKATARLRDDKQKMDANYANLQNDFKRAVARNNTAAVRLRSAISASRIAASAYGVTSAQCRTASERDGELLADMERQGGAMAAEAQRLAGKVTALQAEVRFYYGAGQQPEAAP